MRRFEITYGDGAKTSMDDIKLALNEVEFWLNHRGGEEYLIFRDREFEILRPIYDFIDFTELCDNY